MADDKIDLKPIENLHLEHIIPLLLLEDPKEAEKSGNQKAAKKSDSAYPALGAPEESAKLVAPLFEGTDLFVDPKTCELKTIVDGKTVNRPILNEIQYVYAIQTADTNGDKALDLNEIAQLLAENFPGQDIKPQQFLDALKPLIQVRWARLAANMTKLSGDLNFKPTLDALDVYNEGLYVDEERLALSVMPLNGLTKTAGNALSFIPYNVGRLVTWNHLSHKPHERRYGPVGEENWTFKAKKKEEKSQDKKDASAKDDKKNDKKEKVEATDKEKKGEETGTSWLLFDDLALDSAKAHYEERTAALQDLKNIIEEALSPYEYEPGENGAAKRNDKGEIVLKKEKENLKPKTPETWALEGNLAKALEILKKRNPDSHEILSTMIPAQKLHDILTKTYVAVDPKATPDQQKKAAREDQKQMAEALYEFAVAERPEQWTGYFGGNTTGGKSWCNYTGRYNNLYFARSVLASLLSKFRSGQEGDPEAAAIDAEIQKKATAQRQAMGSGMDVSTEGSFANVISSGVTHAICWTGGGLSWASGKVGWKWETCEPTPLRPWGDEARMDRLGRAADIGLSLYGSYKTIQFTRHFWAYKSMRGLWQHTRGPGALKVWWRELGIRPRWLWGKNGGWTGLKFFPANKMKEAREAAAVDNATNPIKDAAPKGYWGKKAVKFKDWALGPIPDEAANALGKLGKGVGKGIKATESFAINYVLPVFPAAGIDASMKAYYNPFENNSELELQAYPDITKIDPLLQPAKDKDKAPQK
jgi:hypothetical protein